MGHAKLLSFKYMLNALPVLLILYLVGNIDIISALLITIGLVAISYVIGDLVVLPRGGRFIALIGDIGLTVVLLWFVRQWGIEVPRSAVIYSALAVAAAEGLVYHPYLKRLVSLDSMGPRIGKRK